MYRQKNQDEEETKMILSLRYLVCLVVLLFVLSPEIFAEEREDRFEVAGQFSLLVDRNRVADNKEAIPGFGATFGYFPLKYLGFEADCTFYAKKDFVSPTPGSSLGFNDFPVSNYNGPAHVTLFGIRAGIRSKNIGLFVKARPGFAVFRPVYDCVFIENILDPNVTVANSCSKSGKKDFAMDFGGVIEGYLPHHTFVRFDAGDTYLQFGKTGMFFAGNGVRWINTVYGDEDRHHFHLKLGFGIRF
jgi:hypothetical protein